MDAIVLHILKSTALGALFLACYWLYLRKETFFIFNRIYLVLALLTAGLLPFLEITKVVWVTPEPVSYVALTTTNFSEVPVNAVFDWWLLFNCIYGLGVLYFIIGFALQLHQLHALKKKSTVVDEEGFTHVKTQEHVSPFSFFRHLFYCPFQFSTKELQAILEHEKAHAQQYHTLDVLFIQICCILLWFNPLVWLFRIFIKQNLEYLADASALYKVDDKKQYQYLMLQQATGTTMPLGNTFFNSLIKKRIVMLHQNQSNRVKLFKLLVLIPFLAIFLLAFNTNTTYKVKPDSIVSETQVDRSFQYTIKKTTTDAELLQLKNELKTLQTDFSYTTVRNTKNEIIDITLHLIGENSLGKPFNGNYSSNSQRPIAIISLGYDDVSNSLVINEVGTSTPTLNTQKNYTTVNKQLTDITITVNKDSKDADLKNDAALLASKGVKIDFKGIKRNNQGEITSIKVNYDDGKGDKGTYQQKKKGSTITPFAVHIILDKDNVTSINIEGANQVHAHDDNVIIWNALDEIGEHNDIKVIKKGTHKTIELKNIDGEDVVLIDGEQQKIEILNDSMATNNHEFITLLTEDFKNEDGKEVKITTHKIEGDNHVYIIKEEDGKTTINSSEGSKTKKRFKKIKISSEDEEQNNSQNVFIIDTDEAGDFSNDVVIVPDEKDALILIDGKESTYEELKKLSPEAIQTIDISKGKAAHEKYGDKARKGVIEVTTKKEE
ncbi:hypothetical protein GCM10011414_20300 [Croceivirga lutea]|uniref:M56 family metallopeptidase n=1 Tax=Croceivirga lutea TaxID=1775167 RepID=UPI00163A99E4|nr:M56 family metallopeptidase [Croceivirga lutea]GGG50599.1 hypothetical protein GCM10011414_20300 [Croceivirga lutea]